MAASCLYDNFKVVVTGHEDDEPIYNPRFLAFATHYGFRPIACRPHRPQTKGKVERPFLYVADELAQWPQLPHAGASQRDDRLVAGERRRHPHAASAAARAPRELHAEEQPKLIPLPAHPYETALVVYRTVNVEGFISLSAELVLGAVAVHRPRAAGAHHRGRGDHLRPAGRGDRPAPLVPADGHRPTQRTEGDIAPPKIRGNVMRSCKNASWSWEPTRVASSTAWCARSVTAKIMRHKVLALLGTYARADLIAALKRAVRYGAYSFNAVERILAVQARPKTVLGIVGRAGA